jgi:hypothetical protein
VGGNIDTPLRNNGTRVGQKRESMNFLLFVILIPHIIIECEIIHHYVPHSYQKSCGQSCQKYNFQCSDEMNTLMDCYHSAMLYCQVYLNLDTNEELRHHEVGCLVNCEKLLYYQNGVVDCDTGHSSLSEEFRRPHIDDTIPICNCYTEKFDEKKLMTPRLKLGLIFLGISVAVYLLVEMCYKLTKGRSYIRYTSFTSLLLMMGLSVAS